MTNDIYDPLDEYVNTFRPKFEKVVRDTFAQLAQEAQVDVKANQETCSRLYDTEDELEEIGVNEKVRFSVLCEILDSCSSDEDLRQMIKDRADDLIPKHIIKDDIFATINYLCCLGNYNPHIEVNGGKPEDVERIMTEDKKRFEKWRREQEEYERRTRIKPKPKLA